MAVCGAFPPLLWGRRHAVNESPKYPAGPFVCTTVHSEGVRTCTCGRCQRHPHLNGGTKTCVQYLNYLVINPQRAALSGKLMEHSVLWAPSRKTASQENGILHVPLGGRPNSTARSPPKANNYFAVSVSVGGGGGGGFSGTHRQATPLRLKYEINRDNSNGNYDNIISGVLCARARHVDHC